MPKQEELRVLCPFCSAVQTAEVVTQLESISEGCSSCGYGATAAVRVEVRCSSCEFMLKKELS